MLKIVLMFVKVCVLLGYDWYEFESKNDFDIFMDYDLILCI